MTPIEYRTALARLSWSQREAARFFKVDERTSRAWADIRGKSGPPGAVAMWLRFMLATDITPGQVKLALMNYTTPPLKAASDPVLKTQKRKARVKSERARGKA